MRYTGILEQAARGGSVHTSGKEAVGEIFIPENKLNGAPFGMLVVVEIQATLPVLNPNGEVVEVLGDPALPNVAMEGIIRQYNLQSKFSPEIVEEADQVPRQLTEVDVTQALHEGRKDLRSLRTVTIDGKDAKDLDDALSIMILPGGAYRLWVHIADVAHYVKEDSLIDRSAWQRGTSVYLADRVLPMLPPQLSNGICSLNPQLDRFALTVMLDFDPDANLIAGDVFETIIHSNLRANYEDVYAALYEDQVPELYAALLSDLQIMRELAEKLKQKREEKGCLTFDFPETKVDLDSQGKVLAVRPYPTNAANGIIEEFMIAANVYIAERFAKIGAPFLYRVHEEPDKLKLRRFLDLAKIFGLKLKSSGLMDTKGLASALTSLHDTAAGPVLSQLLLQAMAKARYDVQSLGHFGLAEKYYCHFTSPIRRYPDLFIHRVIKGYLHGKAKLKKWKLRAPQTAIQSSNTERSAMYAEFDSIDLKIAEYMLEHIGEDFDGNIVGMNSAGMFIRLDSTAEGMLPFRTMNDYFRYDEDRMEATGSHSGKIYRIGERMSVMVARASIESRQVDFVLADPTLRSRYQDVLGEKNAKRLQTGEQDAAATTNRGKRGAKLNAKSSAKSKGTGVAEGGKKSKADRKKETRRKKKEAKQLAERLKREKRLQKQKLKADSLKAGGHGENY